MCLLVRPPAHDILLVLTRSTKNGKLKHEQYIGYRFAKAQWGRGYTTEATKKIIEYGFKNLGIEKITCVVIPEHTASIRVAEKIGFTNFIDCKESGLDVRRYQMSNIFRT